jgi:hypothetical protein
MELKQSRVETQVSGGDEKSELKSIRFLRLLMRFG